MYGSIRKIIDQETRVNEIITAVNNNINSNSDNSSNGLLRAIKHQQNIILIQLSISGKIISILVQISSMVGKYRQWWLKHH